MVKSIEYVSTHFWRKHQRRLRHFGVTQDDVKQQAWVSYLELEQIWPTNPGKYVGYRLTDWMRAITNWDHRKKKLHPSLVLMEALPDVPVTMDVEMVELIEKVRAQAQRDAGHFPIIFHQYLEGYTMREIGQTIGRTEALVSIRLGQLFRRVRQTLLPLALVGLVFVPGAWAQAPEPAQGCVALTWQANTEADLAWYSFRRTDEMPFNPPPSTTITIAKDATSIPCATLGFVPGHIYTLGLAAVDTSLNASAYATVRVAWVAVDTTAPAPPALFCLDVTMQGVPKKLCAVIQE